MRGVEVDVQVIRSGTTTMICTIVLIAREQDIWDSNFQKLCLYA